MLVRFCSLFFLFVCACSALFAFIRVCSCMCVIVGICLLLLAFSSSLGVIARLCLLLLAFLFGFVCVYPSLCSCVRAFFFVLFFLSSFAYASLRSVLIVFVRYWLHFASCCSSSFVFVRPCLLLLAFFRECVCVCSSLFAFACFCSCPFAFARSCLLFSSICLCLLVIVRLGLRSSAFVRACLWLVVSIRIV